MFFRVPRDIFVGPVLTSLLVLWLSAENGRAIIGESEAQCVARYGAEFDVNDNLAFDVVGDKSSSFAFTFGGASFTVSVIFLNGIDGHETIRPADPAHAMSEAQKNAILESERAGLTWKKERTIYRTDRSDTTYGSQRWIRSDGATATCWLSRQVKAQDAWDQIDLSTAAYAAAQRTLDQQNGAN